MPDSKLTRLTFGFNKCSKPLLLVLILLHTSNKSLEEVRLQKERKRNKMMEVLLRLKLLLKPRHKPKLKLMQRNKRESAKQRPRRIVKDKPRRKSNSVLPTSNKSKSN